MAADGTDRAAAATEPGATVSDWRVSAAIRIARDRACDGVGSALIGVDGRAVADRVRSAVDVDAARRRPASLDRRRRARPAVRGSAVGDGSAAGGLDRRRPAAAARRGRRRRGSSATGSARSRRARLGGRRRRSRPAASARRSAAGSVLGRLGGGGSAVAAASRRRRLVALGLAGRRRDLGARGRRARAPPWAAAFLASGRRVVGRSGLGTGGAGGDLDLEQRGDLGEQRTEPADRGDQLVAALLRRRPPGYERADRRERRRLEHGRPAVGAVARLQRRRGRLGQPRGQRRRGTARRPSAAPTTAAARARPGRRRARPRRRPARASAPRPAS